MGGGGGFIDYDGDGWPDVVLVGGGAWPGAAANPAHRSIRLYHNERNGRFTDVSAQSGLVGDFQGMGVAIGDYDNDGYDDLLVTALGGSHLYHNVPDGRGGRRFAEVTAASGIRDGGWPTSAAWVDYDGDGRLDLFVCHYLAWTPATDRACGASFKAYCGPQEYSGEPCRLYRNDGNGRFTDVTAKAGILNPHSKALGVCVCDIDGDGWSDLIVANDTEPDNVYHNLHGRFEEIGMRSGVALSAQATARAGMGIDGADYRHDGGMGLAIGNFSQEGLALYDLGAGASGLLATERAHAAGLYDASYRYLTFGLVFADFDNDGWPDIAVANGHVETDIARIHPAETFLQPCLLFRNLGNGAFADVTAAAGAGVTLPMAGRALCRGDYDNDGRVDLLVVGNTGAPRLLHNETRSSGHWLTVRLVGTSCNRDAYGAKVTVEAGGQVQSAMSSGGSSYLSAQDSRLHFGLGSAQTITKLTVHWPGGDTEVCPAPHVDRIVTIEQARAAGAHAPGTP
jgi:hypothetical protein